MDFSVFLYHKLFSCNVQNNNKKENVQNRDIHIANIPCLQLKKLPNLHFFNEDLTVFPILNPKRKKINNLTMDQLQAPALPYKKR